MGIPIPQNISLSNDENDEMDNIFSTELDVVEDSE